MKQVKLFSALLSVSALQVGCANMSAQRPVQEVYNTASLQGVYPEGTAFVSNWGVPVGQGWTQKVASTPQQPMVKAAPMVTMVDTDGDGIADDKDKCPRTKAGISVNGYGCANTEKASVRLEVQFAPGSTNLTGSSSDEIKKIADFMKEFAGTQIEIDGHTDNTGSAELNRTLSQKRAETVMNELVKNHGIPAGRLTAKGFGPDQPVADNKTAAGRARNRRVVAEITAEVEKKK